MHPISKYEKLGFKQILERPWLDLAVNLLLSGKTVQETRPLLMDFILKENTGVGTRSIQTTEFAVSMLKAWISPDADLIPFRAQLLEAAKRLPQKQWNILHWACLIASYPFLLALSDIAGRLFSLQTEVSLAQILTRLQNIYGGREVVERALRYALGTMIRLDLIAKKNSKGVYYTNNKILIADEQIGVLLWKAMLHATKGSRLSISSLRNAPALYAFSLPTDIDPSHCSLYSDLFFQHFMGDCFLSLQ